MYQYQTMRSTGDTSAQDEAERRRRRSRRGNKKNAFGEVYHATDSVCGSPPEFSENCDGVLGAYPIYTTPPQSSNITFNSLPPVQSAEGIDESTETKGENSEISRSCPLPSSPAVQSREFNAGLKEGKKYFDPHWPDQAVNDAIKKGSAFKAKFRVNAHNHAEAYCTVDGISIDIMINGLMAQNRAIEGDTVAITLDPVSCWNKMRGQSVNCLQALENSTSSSENKTLNLSNSNYSPISSPLNLPITTNGHAMKSPENTSHENQMETIEKGEYTQALEKIKSILTFNPNKRPTGRIVSIIKNSPRRTAVVGFFSTKPLLQAPNNNNNHNNNHHNNHSPLNKMDTISQPALHLVPNDPRLPKMAINIKTLPESTKERIRKGDITLQNELIAAKIDEWKEESLFPKAQVVNILGKGGDIDAQISAILYEHSIRTSNFSPNSLNSLPDPFWKVPEAEIQTRRDLREILTFTIDPSTAVDLDDALSVEITADGIFRVGVHIADVAHFVRPGTDLDAEAQMRAMSVYLIQNKVSMLPKELSQGCASLTPGLDRLALSVIWDIDFKGNILSRWIGKSVIFSSCQLSYDIVQEMINTDFNPSSVSKIPQVHGKFHWSDAVNSVKAIYHLSKRLKEARFKDGALRLDNLKLSFLFDEEGTPYDTYRDVERKEAYSLIEEFMLLANKSVAEVISSCYPDCALLRRHPEPNLRKLKEFEGFCAKYGFELDASSSGRLHLSLSKIREILQDDPLLFDILVLYACKPMLPASYFCTGDLEEKEEWGHYALSAPFYTHFTSPIRRYADIVVHRTLYAVFDAEQVCFLRNKGVLGKCFTGVKFDERAAESKEGKEALNEAKEKFRVLGREILGEVAEYCNERKLAARYAEEAGLKLYLWALLKKKEFMVSEARVMGLGPKFMTIYVQKLAGERRLYYDEVEGLVADWLENTGTLLLDLRRKITFHKKAGSFFKHKPLEDFALMHDPTEETEAEKENAELAPAVFPLVLRHLSSVPVALHAIGGDDGPIDVAVRLLACSYFR